MRDEKPEAIMIHVPEAHFSHGWDEFNYEQYEKNKANKTTREQYCKWREDAFRRYYEMMGTGAISEEDCFYHFLSKVPASPELITNIYVCFLGKVQYKARPVMFIKNKPVMLKHYQHPEPRDWVVTTGPVEKPRVDILLSDVWKGMRQGFRYCKQLF